MPIAPNVTALVGNTPLVKLNRISQGCSAELVAKLEYVNPASSIKDRVALALITAAEERGELIPGRYPSDTIVEPTSGNTGIGLALVSAIKGYSLILTMPDTMSIERQLLLRGMGAKLF